MPTKKPSTSAKKKKRHANGNDHDGADSKQASARQLLEAGEQAMSRQEYDHAVAYLDAALEESTATIALSSDDVVDTVYILEKRAEAKVTLGLQDEAHDDYEQALQLVQQQHPAAATPTTALDPLVQDRIGSLWLYMGQLRGGKESVQAYEEGIRWFKSSVATREGQLQQPSSSSSSGNDDPQQQSEQLAEGKKQLAAAYCSAAEVYLTDLCYEDQAEQQCERLVQQALQCYVDEQGRSTVDALQTAASLRLSQCRGMEAVNYIRECYAQIQHPCRAVSELVGMRRKPTESPQELDHLEEIQAMPGFEFRCQTAKLLLECAHVLREEAQQTAEANVLTEAAIDVLGSCLSENDEVIEIWAIAGDAFASCVPPVVDAAQHYWERSLDMLRVVKKSLEEESAHVIAEEEEEEIQQQLDGIVCQMEDIRNKLKELGQTDSSSKVEATPDQMEE